MATVFVVVVGGGDGTQMSFTQSFSVQGKKWHRSSLAQRVTAHLTGKSLHTDAVSEQRMEPHVPPSRQKSVWSSLSSVQSAVVSHCCGAGVGADVGADVGAVVGVAVGKTHVPFTQSFSEQGKKWHILSSAQKVIAHTTGKSPHMAGKFAQSIVPHVPPSRQKSVWFSLPTVQLAVVTQSCGGVGSGVGGGVGGGNEGAAGVQIPGWPIQGMPMSPPGPHLIGVQFPVKHWLNQQSSGKYGCWGQSVSFMHDIDWHVSLTQYPPVPEHRAVLFTSQATADVNTK